MSDRPGQAADGTAHPDTRSLRRRGFLVAAGGAAAGAVGAPAAAQANNGNGNGSGNGNGNRSDAADTGEGGGRVLDDDPNLIAHRGFAGVNPENTVGAVEAASRGGLSSLAPSRRADSIEIDVLPTADGDVVVFHDDKLASRDGGTRGLLDVSERLQGLFAWETSTETITNATVLGTDETVPLLTEVLDAIPPSVGVNVELKNPGSTELEFAANLSGDDLTAQKDLWRPFVHDVLEIVDHYNNDFLFSSFYEAAIALVRENSDYRIAPLLWDSIDKGIEIAREYDAEAIHPPYNMIKGTPFFKDQYFLSGESFEDTDLVAVAHEEGRDVNPYTLGTFYQAEQLAAAGVDGIIADYPDLFRFGATNR